eukprot:504966-Rhodomonas_salina.1
MSGADSAHTTLDHKKEEKNQEDPGPADWSRPRNRRPGTAVQYWSEKKWPSRGFRNPNRTSAKASVGKSRPIVLGLRYERSEQPSTPDSGNSTEGSILLSCYALATGSPEKKGVRSSPDTPLQLLLPRSAIALRTCYGKSGADVGYAGTSGRIPYSGKPGDRLASTLVLPQACSIAKGKTYERPLLRNRMPATVDAAESLDLEKVVPCLVCAPELRAVCEICCSSPRNHPQERILRTDWTQKALTC